MTGRLVHDLVVVIPSPEQGVALRELGMLRTDETPMLAAHWLTEFDSPTLRRLAGLSGSEGWLIDQWWPGVLADLGVQQMTGEQAWDLAVSFQLSAWRAGERTTADVMSHVIRAYIETDYRNMCRRLDICTGSMTNYQVGGDGRTKRCWARLSRP